jgi:hypothetical protein
MSFLTKTLPKVLKTVFIVGLGIYIPVALIFSVLNVDDVKKKEVETKQEIVEASLKMQK